MNIQKSITKTPKVEKGKGVQFGPKRMPTKVPNIKKISSPTINMDKYKKGGVNFPALSPNTLRLRLFKFDKGRKNGLQGYLLSELSTKDIDVKKP